MLELVGQVLAYSGVGLVVLVAGFMVIDALTPGKLGELRASGVQIGIDDFGTGYASLRYLRDLPVTFLKVDRSFVAGMTHNHHDAVIVHTVTRLARDLGLGCVVEGVETQDQLEHILDTGAHAQGYLFGRPVPATGFSHQMCWAYP